MLCNKCNERHATIHLVQIANDKMTTQDLCEVCGKGFVDVSKKGAGKYRAPIIDDPEQIFDGVAARDSRYAKAAYVFVREGLRQAKGKHFGSGCGPGHVSGAGLQESLRELAIATFGRQAKARLNRWGVFKCEDFGEIVFNLVEAGLLAKQAKDSKADFQRRLRVQGGLSLVSRGCAHHLQPEST